MEISSEILETLDVVGNKDVMEALKEGVTEDIIFESAVAEDSEEGEIEEIIEIIEEIEECEETTLENDTSVSKDKDQSACAKNNGTVEKNNGNDRVIDKDVEMYSFDEENSMFSSESAVDEETRNMNNSTQRNKNKQVINYDVDEDWQDEDMERMEVLDDDSEVETQSDSRSNKRHVNNQTITVPLQSHKLNLKVHVEAVGRLDKLRVDNSIEDIDSMEDSGTTHEIVKNVENNLLYTVLGTKKQDSSTKPAQQEKNNDGHYIKVGIISKMLYT